MMSNTAMFLVLFGGWLPPKAEAKPDPDAPDLSCKRPCITCPVSMCALQGTQQELENWDYPVPLKPA